MGDRPVRRAPAGLIAAALALAALAALLTGAFAAPLRAWGGFGHETTAQIALANIRPQTRAGIARLLRAEPLLGTPDCRVRSLAEAANWPDCIRRDGWRWGHTAAWHYRTAPICEAYDARRNCSGGNCVTAQIARNHRLLADETLPDNVRLEALAFLVHFIGDVHMPLHSGDLADRGGNDREVAYGIIPGYNLHAIWDGPLAERAISSAQPPLVRRYSAEERTEFAAGDAAEWGRESWALARSVAYSGAYGVDPCAPGAPPLPAQAVLEQQAIVASLPHTEQRLRQAGLRIARLLDEAFAPGPLPPTEGGR